MRRRGPSTTGEQSGLASFVSGAFPAVGAMEVSGLLSFPFRERQQNKRVSSVKESPVKTEMVEMWLLYLEVSEPIAGEEDEGEGQ